MGAERRTSPRSAVELPPGLRLTVPEDGARPRTVMAKLIDVSEGGIGIEAFVRLSRGTVIEIDGDWHSPDLALRIGGRARIAHVSEVGRGRFRIGLQFVDVALARSA